MGVTFSDPCWKILQLQITPGLFHSKGIALRLTADRDPGWGTLQSQSKPCFHAVTKVPLPWERDLGRGWL